MRAYLRDGSAQTILRAATLRWKLQTKLSMREEFQVQFLHQCGSFLLFVPEVHSACCRDARLVGLVVKASTSRAEGPGFESRLHRDFFGVESYQ